MLVILFLLVGVFLFGFVSAVNSGNLEIKSGTFTVDGVDVTNDIVGVYVLQTDGSYLHSSGARINPFGYAVYYDLTYNGGQWITYRATAEGPYYPLGEGYETGIAEVTYEEVAEYCDLTNHFVDNGTGECVCDFGRGYVLDTSDRGEIACISYSASRQRGSLAKVQSCGFLSEPIRYFLDRNISVLNDPFFQENHTCFIISRDNVRLYFNKNGLLMGDGNGVSASNFYGNGIVISGNNVGVLGNYYGADFGKIVGFNGAGIYVYSTTLGNKIENLILDNNYMGVYLGKNNTNLDSIELNNIKGSGNSYGIVANLPSGNANINLTNFNVGESIGVDPLGNPLVPSTPVPFVKISNCTELQNISNDLNANYELMNDIDCSGFNFFPISSFRGILDGRGYKIINFSLNSPLNDYSSAFIMDNYGTIKNFGFKNAVVFNIGSVAGFVNRNYGIINKSYFEGSVGCVIGCKGSGVERQTRFCTSNSCQAFGMISSNYGIVENSYSIVNVTGSGIASLFNGFRGTIRNSYAIGNAYSSPTGARGLHGYYSSNYNSFAIIKNKGESFYYDGIGSNFSQSVDYFKNNSNQPMASWDTSIWNLTDGQYPKLKWQN